MLIELLVSAYPDLSGRLTTTGEVTGILFFSDTNPAGGITFQ